MAYFSALGGTGGTSATITVTYSEDFYGLTITATNGTTTLTKTATSSGTLTFTVSEGGTWIVSGVVEGSTYSEQVDVTFEYTTPQLIALPDGSTATPVNSIAMWLKCAGIRDKSYTTLSQVLNDTETFIALCADSNACDYMARSTNWASGVAADSTAMLIVGKYNYCANKLISNATWAEALAESDYWAYVFDVSVPKMTGNTAPSGEVSATNYYSTNWEPWRAFNGNYSSNGWQCAVNSQLGNTYIQYKFTTPVVIKAVSAAQVFLSGTPSYTKVLTYKLLASNDNFVSDTHELATNMVVDDFNDIKYFAINNDTAYQYYRMVITDFSQTGGADIASGYGNKFQFYGRSASANYIPLVPKMTSATTPSGEVTASGEYSSVGRYAWKAFDGSASGDVDQWHVMNVTSGWIAYKFPQAILANAVMIKPSPSSYGSRIKDFQIIGSNDDFATTDTLYGGTMPNEYANVTWHTYMFTDNTVAYRSYKVNVLNTYDTQSNIGAYEIQFYRKSDLPIIHSAVEDNIFYMDDGSPVALCGIPVGDTIDVDLESFKGQTLTLVSTVAKDPDNLSNDFTMPVRITPNITEIYLMPLKSLYWWGHKCDKLTSIRDTNAASISFGKDKITIGHYASTSNNGCGVYLDYALDISTISSINIICNYGNTTSSVQRVGYSANASAFKATGIDVYQDITPTTNVTKYSKAVSGTGNKYIGYTTNGYPSASYIYALWLE